jgi:hypothetical protein
MLWRILGTRCRKWYEAGEKYVKRSFISYALRENN